MCSTLGTSTRQRFHLKWCDAASGSPDPGRRFLSACCALDGPGSLPTLFISPPLILITAPGCVTYIPFHMRKVSTEKWRRGSSDSGGEGAGFYLRQFAVGVVLFVALLKCLLYWKARCCGGGEGQDRGKCCSLWSDTLDRSLRMVEEMPV